MPLTSQKALTDGSVEIVVFLCSSVRVPLRGFPPVSDTKLIRGRDLEESKSGPPYGVDRSQGFTSPFERISTFAEPVLDPGLSSVDPAQPVELALSVEVRLWCLMPLVPQ